MKKSILSLFAIAIVIMLVSCKADYADTVVYGTIHTADDECPVAEAIAIKDGKFVYVGDKAGVESYIKEGVTEVVDHTGKGMVMPGCYDGHAHYMMTICLANMKGGLLFAHEDGKAEILKKVDAAALEAVNSGKHCLFGFGWDMYKNRMTDHITLAELDAVSHGLSIALFDSGGHNMYCNTECFRRCGIIDDKGNVLIKEIPGGLLEMDENGHVTGFIDERVTGYPMRMGGIDSDEIIDDEVASIALEKAQELLISNGYVSYMEGWSNAYHPTKFYEVANRFDKEGKLKLLLSMTYEVEPWQKDMSEQIDNLASLNEKYGTTHVRPQYLKVFMDGVVEGTTGSMYKPYKSGIAHYGHNKNGFVYNCHWPVDYLADVTRECNSKGLTVHTHVMGDKAVAEATDAYIKGGDGEHRNCLVHLRNVRKEDFKRLAENNIACTAGITWHVTDELSLAVLPKYIDESYVLHGYPIKSFFDAGVKASSHTDYPANGACPQDPFGIMEIAMTGQMIDQTTGKPTPLFDTEELVTLEQAFQALTINGAWQLGLDSERGSIKVGKYADFVLADQDIFSCPVTDIHKTKVVSTWFEGEKVYQSNVSKVADYLYELEADDYGKVPPTALLTDDGKVAFGCSAVRNGNFYGRNLDLGISENCEFIVRTKATAERKHASIGVANTCFLTLTNDIVRAGLSEEQLKLIPWMMMDGVNDSGLVCNINVVNQADIEKNMHTHTNPGKPQIMVMQLVRALLDNCGSVEEAKEFINNHDITPIPEKVGGGWDGHIMIADADNTVIVEFTGEKGSEVKFVEMKIMTNFYNHLYAATAKYPPHACGVERFKILSENYDTGNTMEGMWKLMKMVQYTLAYKESVEPFWCSEHIDGIPGSDISWTKEQILAEEETQKMLAAYKVYEKTGEYNLEDGMWFTAHNSTYDIANKTLWVTIREKYDKHYEFKL
ncbi:MAG: amidohydrolase family protein [Prevotella sp.]|nr:amidohydrolase family protein [Candidatus Equicola stercoris]